MRKIIDCTDEATTDRIKYIVKVDSEEADKIIAYNEIVEYLQSQFDDVDEEDRVWTFRKILDHKGPIHTGDPDYKGSPNNVLIQWESNSEAGETTWEPLEIIAQDDPVTLAIYARDNDLLDVPRWKRFKRIAKCQKYLIRAVKQS